MVDNEYSPEQLEIYRKDHLEWLSIMHWRYKLLTMVFPRCIVKYIWNFMGYPHLIKRQNAIHFIR